MSDSAFEQQLKRLVIGLADQQIKKGQEFYYDGGRLFADEVADVTLPSLLCLAQHMSERVGLGSFGYQFELGEVNPVFPLRVQRVGTASFFQVAPFVLEIFDSDLLECRSDLAMFFERAAKLVTPEFDLRINTNHCKLQAMSAQSVQAVSVAVSLGGEYGTSE